MPYAVVAEKLKSVPECYLKDVSEYIDFLLFKAHETSSQEKKNGLDKAIEEVERGEVEVFNSFDEFKAAMA